MKEPRHEQHPVEQDWVAPLPGVKHRLFDRSVNSLEASYAMLSVALDQAFALREQASLVCARGQIGMAAELLARFTDRLRATLAALAEEGGRLRRPPSVAPLCGEFFRGETAQSAATWSRILHFVLPLARPRYHYKLQTLETTVAGLTREFCEAALEIAEGSCVNPPVRWRQLDEIHYDLNTCLRETIVLLKSFLCSLPVENLEAFEVRLERTHALPLPEARAKIASISP